MPVVGLVSPVHPRVEDSRRSNPSSMQEIIATTLAAFAGWLNTSFGRIKWSGAGTRSDFQDGTEVYGSLFEYGGNRDEAASRGWTRLRGALDLA